MDEIIVIRAADPDGSIFKAIVNALKDKRTEAVHVAGRFRCGEHAIDFF